MKKSGGDRLKCAVCESTLSTAARSPFPKGEGKEEAASPQKRKPTPPRCARQPLPREGARVVIPSFHRKEVPRRGGGWMGGSAVPETKPSPRGEGGERSEPDRVLAVGKRAGKIVSSRQFTRAPERRYAVPLPQWGRQIGGGFAEIDDEVAAVLAFVISSATFLAAQDDETGRCPKVVCKSLMMYTALKGFRVQGSKGSEGWCGA